MAYPNLVLYHYTGGHGLVGILDSKQVWATNIHCLNDSKEFVHALTLAKFAVRQVLEEQVKEDFEIIYAAVENSLNSISELSVYVSCFSEVADSLSQWRGYCPPGFGYCIGFDGSELESEARQQGFILGRCVYDRGQQEKICLEWANNTVRRLKENLMESSDIDSAVTNASEYFLEDLYKFAPLLKHHSFHGESEWRLFGLIGAFDTRLRVRPAKSMLVRYLGIDLKLGKDSDMIWNIMVGPTPHQQLAVGALTTYFNKVKIRNGIGTSDTPYRDW
jgi:hypothetical protein